MGTKEETVRNAILLYWRCRSARGIAEDLGVSNTTVAKHWKALADEGQVIPIFPPAHPAEACQGRVCSSAIKPAELNDQLYDPVDEDDPAFKGLVKDIRENGILEPLVVSCDGYILSGHRRHAAARVLELARIPIRVRRDVSYRADQDKFLRLLASFNRSRVKNTSEQFREEIALMSNDSTSAVRSFRSDAAEVDSDFVELGERKRRSKIKGKLELRNAIIRVVEEERKNWPISDRTVHYRLLNIPGLVRNDKTRTPYLNNDKSYNDVTNMLTRLRIDGSVPFESITDETRPVSIWDTHRCFGDFARKEIDSFMKGYFRDLLQSQPNWLELMVEKNTVASQLRSVAAKYTIPMTSGRGYSSVPPRKEMVDRFKASGREKLVVLVVSDFDPEGEDIPRSLGESLLVDFHVPPEKLLIVKASLTADQVRTMNLHEGQEAKPDSSRYKRFAATHGEKVWELESLTSDQLRKIVEGAIRNVLDMSAFDEEVKREEFDQKDIEEHRRHFRLTLLTDMKLNQTE